MPIISQKVTISEANGAARGKGKKKIRKEQKFSVIKVFV